jgi:phenylalanyl-tRNA synthetase alpha chain
MSVVDQLNQILETFKNQVSEQKNKADLLNLKSLYLGKDGQLTSILKGMRNFSIDERKEIGPKANVIKSEIEKTIFDALNNLELQKINDSLMKNKIDLTLTEDKFDNGLDVGGYHPVSIIQREIEDIFMSMGFEILDGPHVEDDFHNFEALNIPADHPARDMQDTFWFSDKKHLLRTHTSTIQVRGMKERKPPFKFVGPGKVFRNERTDASHEMVFHQLEGMMVDKDISVSNLIYFMKSLLSEVFKKEMEVRLRPGFFPFVEPGFELDIRCLICSGKGCSVCKKTGWVELLPCGMVHPNVLKAGGIDPEVYNGFAFGLGLDRLVMMRYGIDDIRHLHGADLRFNKQFSAY